MLNELYAYICTLYVIHTQSHMGYISHAIQIFIILYGNGAKLFSVYYLQEQRELFPVLFTEKYWRFNFALSFIVDYMNLFSLPVNTVW